MNRSDFLRGFPAFMLLPVLKEKDTHVKLELNGIEMNDDSKLANVTLCIKETPAAVTFVEHGRPLQPLRGISFGRSA
jgi:hypothetical protein